MNAVIAVVPRMRAVSAAVALGLASAVATANAQNLPAARAVLARYVEATGAAKLPSQKGYHVKGTFEVVAQGLRGTLEGWRDLASGRSVQVLTLPGLGEIKTGLDAEFGWSTSPFEGAKILDLKEFTEQREKDDVRTMQRDPAVVLEALAIERTVVDSQPCIVLKLKWKSGRETTECYSEATGLLVRSEAVETTSAGAIPTITLFSEYKKFGDITMPTKAVQRAAVLEITQRITDVEFGAVDATKLTPPAEILALRKQ
ncbi:MAG TPA: hypothetical protein VJR92_14660 [Gemmatimonadaceae bacterium]|nr:hypothetical protein [Gemmatimonadaceae bacterium]